MEPDAIEDGASAEVSYVYGPEIPWADPGSNPLGFDAAFTEKGERRWRTSRSRKPWKPARTASWSGDATPGKYGDFGRCPEKHFVLQVEAALEPEETGGGGGRRGTRLKRRLDFRSRAVAYREYFRNAVALSPGRRRRRGRHFSAFRARFASSVPAVFAPLPPPLVQILQNAGK